ncbi:MAG: N-acetylmuramoyl-L-alanine amidase [Oscillospiraceae bacterium]|nr:N-acetylmuramoyl-L-alanine amidase [Oscillospiraceae bacterium]MDD4545993.1 N-acetylmuramoyl-L-alanine amidase [Oscillospiraceae bacterium]
MAFRIAINAGHYIGTPGRRIPKAIDKNQTREWTLNNRVVLGVTQGLKAYQGYEIIRLDDPSGKKDLALKERTDGANNFGANIYVSVHHNAAGRDGNTYNASGVVVYAHTSADEKTKALQKTVYDCLIAATNNKGNRASPIAYADFHEVREPNCPAVLCECGFMDGITDGKLMLKDKYASQLAQGLVNAIVKVGKLKPKPPPKPPAKPAKIKVGDKVRFRGGNVYISSTAKSASGNKGKATCQVTGIAPSAPHPYHCIGGGVYGWVNAADISANPATAGKPPPTDTFMPGDRVKAASNAVWVSTGKPIPAWLRALPLYIRSHVSNGTVVVSWKKWGAISGRTYTKYLKKY